MNKKLIRLTEQDLHRIVKESVNRILNEELPQYNETTDNLRKIGGGINIAYSGEQKKFYLVAFYFLGYTGRVYFVFQNKCAQILYLS